MTEKSRVLSIGTLLGHVSSDSVPWYDVINGEVAARGSFAGSLPPILNC